MYHFYGDEGPDEYKKKGGNIIKKLDITGSVIYVGLAVLGVGTVFTLMVVVVRKLILGA